MTNSESDIRSDVIDTKWDSLKRLALLAGIPIVSGLIVGLATDSWETGLATTATVLPVEIVLLKWVKAITLPRKPGTTGSPANE